MAVITRWSYKWGGRKTGFHCIYKKTFSLEQFDVAFVCLNYAPVNVNPHPRDISRHLREIFPYLTSEMA